MTAIWVRTDRDGWPLEEIEIEARAKPASAGHPGDDWVKVRRRCRPGERLVDGRWVADLERARAAAARPIEGRQILSDLAIFNLSVELARVDGGEPAGDGMPWLAAIARELASDFDAAVSAARDVVARVELRAIRRTAIAIAARHNIRSLKDPMKMREAAVGARAEMEEDSDA